MLPYEEGILFDTDYNLKTGHKFTTKKKTIFNQNKTHIEVIQNK